MKTLSWKRRLVAASVFFAAALGAAQLPARAVDVATAATQAASAPLLLNGAGTRRETSADLYTADLHLEHKTSNPDDILQNSLAKQFRLVFLHDVSATQLADLLTQGLVANASEDDLVTLVSEIFDISVMLSEQGKFSAGDSIQIDSHPATGTTVAISSTRSAPITQTFANPRMFSVMMGIWLGEHPADLGLKSALLGKKI